MQLRAGGFQHRDPRVGWVATPMFVVVGRHPADGVAKPDTSPWATSSTTRSRLSSRGSGAVSASRWRPLSHLEGIRNVRHRYSPRNAGQRLLRLSHALGSAPRSPGGSTRPTPAPTRCGRGPAPIPACSRRYTPTIDIDITDPEAAALAEEVGQELFGDRGVIPVRFGRSPKRALVLRTAAPFPKMSASFEAPNGATHKIEILADGQQLVCFGTHPDIGQPYTWCSRTPLDTPRAELAEVDEADMQAYLDLVSERLAEEYDFKRVYTNGHDDELGAGPVDVDERLELNALRRRRRQQRPRHAAARHRVTAAQWGRFRRNCAHCPRGHQEGRQRRSSRSEVGTGTTSS